MGRNALRALHAAVLNHVTSEGKKVLLPAVLFFENFAGLKIYLFKIFDNSPVPTNLRGSRAPLLENGIRVSILDGTVGYHVHMPFVMGRAGAQLAFWNEVCLLSPKRLEPLI